MITQAQVKAVLTEDDEAEQREDVATLRIELDAIPGAVWQAELTSSLPPDVRVTLFELGAQKCALLTFPPGQQQYALEVFEKARKVANEVSDEAHAAARAARASRSPATGG
ncbi:MAG TPA: hypothetical protein VEX18_02640 [Polyangiaceae bacterium]|jgi:hypothetical protein|nr:hypothetical protein [Polyangiaceae bacterium]